MEVDNPIISTIPTGFALAGIFDSPEFLARQAGLTEGAGVGEFTIWPSGTPVEWRYVWSPGWSNRDTVKWQRGVLVEPTAVVSMGTGFRTLRGTLVRKAEVPE